MLHIEATVQDVWAFNQHFLLIRMLDLPKPPTVQFEAFNLQLK